MLRWVYGLIEEVTNHQVYVWNHDDDENLYCKPHPYLTIEEVLNYRKLSRRMRHEREKVKTLRIKSETSYTEDPHTLQIENNIEEVENATSVENAGIAGRTRQWTDLLRFGTRGANTGDISL